MKRIGLLLSAIALSAFVTTASADEGMWMIHNQIKEILKEMRREGLKLSAEDIYNEQAPALADAVVAINGGMGTGSVISDEGLVITNHHVAYDDIHSLSSMEHNYLEEGFAARTRADELPTGTSVTFLRKTIDVTDRALALRAEWEKEGKWGSMSMRRLMAQLEREYAEDGYEVSVSGFWRNLKFYAYYYVTYRDVRLVAAPSVHLGAFGGDTDNWGWPQHKCDFAIYRVYTAPDGSPADFSTDNIPLRPRKVLKVSTKGIHDGDFTMVIGYPGSTNRYMSSYAVAEKESVRNPIVYEARRAKLDVMKRHMEADAAVRLKYSDRYFGISNYTDYARWENICLRRFAVADELAADEVEFRKWAASSTDYANLLPSLAKGYEARREAAINRTYYQEEWFGACEALIMAGRAVAIRSRLERDHIDVIAPDAPVLKGILSAADRFDNTDYATERDIFAEMFCRFVGHVDRQFIGAAITDGIARHGSAREFALWAYDNSAFTTKEGVLNFFAEPKTFEQIVADPLVALSNAVQYRDFAEAVDRAEKSVGIDVDLTEADYQRALYAYRAAQGEMQYPNANSTMRLSYGSVCSLAPADGVHYASRTTSTGYFEKADPANYDFSVSDELRSALTSDYGRWGEKGTLYVDFISDNDITGGNSGSPVMNGRGELVGLAFDGNRESMAGDIRFNPTMSRTVSVDIRFVMWALERVLGAENLIAEIEFK